MRSAASLAGADLGHGADLPRREPLPPSPKSSAASTNRAVTRVGVTFCKHFNGPSTGVIPGYPGRSTTLLAAVCVCYDPGLRRPPSR